MNFFPTIMAQTPAQNIGLPESSKFKNDLKSVHWITAKSIHERSHGSWTAISLPFADGYCDQKTAMSYMIETEAVAPWSIPMEYNWKPLPFTVRFLLCPDVIPGHWDGRKATLRSIKKSSVVQWVIQAFNVFCKGMPCGLICASIFWLLPTPISFPNRNILSIFISTRQSIYSTLTNAQAFKPNAPWPRICLRHPISPYMKNFNTGAMGPGILWLSWIQKKAKSSLNAHRTIIHKL